MISRTLPVVMVAVVAASAGWVGAAFGDHRPNNVVVIGGTTSQTGRYAVPAGRIHKGLKLYVENSNARGGLLGHDVDL